MREKRICRVLMAVMLLLVCYQAGAFAQESANYAMTINALTMGGQDSSSTSYAMDCSVVGSCIGGGAQSGTLYGIESGYSQQEEMLYEIMNSIPPQPEIDAVDSPRSGTALTLTGTKSSDTTVINVTSSETSIGAVSFPTSTTWSCSVTLAEGANIISVTAENVVGNESTASAISITVDSSAPDTPQVTDDGVYTASSSQLSVTWVSDDEETGITESKYAIGTSAGATDVRSWTSVGSALSVTATGLSLTQGQDYYFSVQTKNGVDLWSDTGVSDGIYVNGAMPVINSVSLISGDIVCEEALTPVTVSATDADNDTLEYRFSIGGSVVADWSTSFSYAWTPAAGSFGSTTVLTQVRDGYGGNASSSANVYIVKNPPLP